MVLQGELSAAVFPQIKPASREEALGVNETPEELKPGGQGAPLKHVNFIISD